MNVHPGVLVGVDESVHSDRALEWGMHEAELRRIPLRVVQVIAPVPNQAFVGYPENRGVSEETLAMMREHLHNRVIKLAANRGRDLQVPLSVAVVVGDPARELQLLGRRADLLVVGSRGAGVLRRALLGSVSSSVIQHAPCPVTVVPTDQLAAEQEDDRAGARA